MTPRHLEAQTTITSPLGPMLLAASARGLAGLWFDAQRHHPAPFDAPEDPDHRWLRLAASQLEAYWQDAVGTTFDLPLDLHGGTPFQQAVWQALLTVPAGRTVTYGHIANLVARPQAVRAVGAAVGRNPVGIIVPCHRIVGSDGSLTGYAGGLDRKRDLLARERIERQAELAF